MRKGPVPQQGKVTASSLKSDASDRRWLSWEEVCILICCVALSAGFLFLPQEQPEPLPDFGVLKLPAGLLVLPQEQPEPLPDFGVLNTPERKAQFFGYLSPMIAAVNEQARADRAFLLEISQSVELSRRLAWFQLRGIETLADRYEVPHNELDLSAVLRELENRVGAVPESLVLIQAAKESGWGTSRFAVEGNNLFGQRCYSEDCGIVPLKRDAGASFGVAKFDSVAESVASYALNLNTHSQYSEFRDLRQELRARDEPLTGLALADGLLGYSERGQDYVDEVRSMIRQNGLE